MRHIYLGPTPVRVGVIRGQFCYQPFASGRLRKAIPLFRDLGSAEVNEAFFLAHYAVVVGENGDITVERKKTSHSVAG
jgi:hypothetical protein